METNGTRPAPNRLDWICVSEKAELEQRIRYSVVTPSRRDRRDGVAFVTTSVEHALPSVVR